MRTAKMAAMGITVLWAAVLVLATGCEKTQTSLVLEVTPPSSEIGRREAVKLTATLPEGERENREIYYPLAWSVSNPAIGILRETAGNSAVYEAGNAEGVNTITVRDQSGAEGVAAVTQFDLTENAP